MKRSNLEVMDAAAVMIQEADKKAAKLERENRALRIELDRSLRKLQNTMAKLQHFKEAVKAWNRFASKNRLGLCPKCFEVRPSAGVVVGSDGVPVCEVCGRGVIVIAKRIPQGG